MELENKVALITGPAKGMGKAISLSFANEGCHLVLVGRDRIQLADRSTGPFGPAFEIGNIDVAMLGVIVPASQRTTMRPSLPLLPVLSFAPPAPPWPALSA